MKTIRSMLLFGLLGASSAPAFGEGEGSVQDQLADLVAHGDTDEAAVILEHALVTQPEQGREIIAAFCDAVLVEAAQSKDASLRAAAAPGLHADPSGLEWLQRLARDPDPTVRRAAARPAKPPAHATAVNTGELIERLIAPVDVQDRVAGAALFFLAGLNERHPAP